MKFSCRLPSLGDTVTAILKERRDCWTPGDVCAVTPGEFLDLLSRSGLLDAPLDPRLQQVARGAAATPHADGVDRLCASLIESDLLTAWQCRKLIDRKHKGFYLGSYKLCDHLSVCDTHSVYRAVNWRLRKDAAIVAITPFLQARIDHKQLNAALSALASLRHPAILQLLDLFEASGIRFLVREFAHGCDLPSLISHVGALSIGASFAIAAEYAEVVSAIHSPSGRDIAVPLSNLVVDTHGALRVRLPLSQTLQRLGRQNSDLAMETHDADHNGVNDIISVLAALLSGNAELAVAAKQGERRDPMRILRELAPAEACDIFLRIGVSDTRTAASAISNALVAWLIRERISPA